MGLKEFLVTTKKGLAELQTHERIHVVIGNESCDLDSTVSAVTYAYFLHETKSKPDTLILPVLNIPRQLFRLRLEISFLLHKHNITQDDLIFVDELDLQALTQVQDVVLSVTLVDHHVVSAGQECLKDFVVEVLDHRPLAGVLPERWSAEVERVGSCCTLVARKMLASETFNLDSAVAELLLGTILMDTGNMSPIDNVGTPSDLEVISQLKAYVPPGTADDLFEGIRKAKADLSSLTVLEMLYKDLKVLRGTHITVAMSSLTAKLEDIMSRPEFPDDCAAFCSACPADVLIIMTLWKDGSGSSFRRIAVFSQNRIYREQVKDVLLNSVSPNLELEPMTSYSHIDNISAFFQNNVQVFRKGVAPLIQKFLAGEESTPDENLNAVDNLDPLYPDSPLGSDLLDEVADVSEEEVRKHINLAKAFQSDQFRTSQDWYDLAAVGTDPVISASLSSDSEFSIGDKKKIGGGDDDDDNASDNEVEKKGMVDKSFEFVGGAKMSEDFFINEKSGAGDGANVDGLVDMKAAVSDGDGLFVNDLIDFEFGGKDREDIVSPSDEVNSDFTQVGDGREQGFLNRFDAPFSVEPEEVDQGFLSNSLDAPFNIEPQVDQGSFSDFDVKVSDSRDDTMGDLLSISSDNIDVDSTLVDAKDENNFGDAFQDQSPFNILGPDGVDSPGDIISMPTSNQTSGQGSKLPSYPETPPNSCMEPSNVIFNKETQLPSFNSSEMVKRIHEKKAALAGYGGKQKTGMFDDEGPLEELLLGGDNSSGGGGSLISPAVPQNSYVDVSRGFEFESSDSQLPTLMDSDIMERVNEKRSQFEWSIESLDGSTSGVDIGPVSEEGERSPFVTDAAQNATISGGMEPQVPYTPQNSYVEENFDSYARANLPSLNNAEIVAKIKAKQSAMFGNHGSSRVSRSSHGSDDSGGCHSPEIVDKSPRGTSLDSPQAPYTPQNSYRDNLGSLETRNHLPDLNEVAERLSTENPLKRQFGKRSGSNSGGGSRDEENINLNIHQHGLRHHGRNSSSQSDSQNTMSDVESLMSVSTEVGTPSDNIVASGLANQMRGEIAMLSRKDTDDSDVFSPKKPDNDASEAREVPTPRVSSIDLTFDDAAGYNIVGTVSNGIDTDGGSGGVVRSDSGGVKELFSPYDSEKVQSMEDHALFQAAESIVAQSVAAAVEFSQKETQSSQGKNESRLRWNDDDDDDDEADNENEYKARRSPTVFYRGDEEEDNDESDVEDDTVGDISESFPENDLNKTGSKNGNTENINAPDARKDMTTGSFKDPDVNSDFKSHSVPEQSHSQVDQMKEDSRSQQNPGEDYAQEEELTESLGFNVLDREEQANTSSVPLVSQSITDLTLNELAFELANELIQSVLDDFPFSEYLATIQSEAGARDVGQGAGTVGTQNIPSQGTLSQSSWTPVSAEMNTSANNDSDNTAEITDNSGTILASTVSQESSHDPSLSSERKRLKGSDPSLVILEDEMLANFPERKMSSEFSGVEEDEEIIVSFPGRKFSKSEDYPSRRFSRDENSSRFEDSELEVTIGPEDIETGYLPSMDPLQGNLDIFETSFSKITDADREVAEEESFRRASGGGVVSDEEEEEDSDNDEGSIKRVDDGGSNRVFGVEDDFDNVESENLRRAGGEGVSDEEEEEEDRLGENEESSHRVYDSESYRGVGVEDENDVTRYAGLVEAGRSIPEVREELVSDEEDVSEKEGISGEAAFSKITDVDKEDVEEESIRKASGGGIASDQENEEDDKISDNEEESSEKVFGIESNRVIGVQASNVDVSDAGLVETRRSIPEVIEELVSDEEDFSRELYPQVADNQTKEEDVPRETASGKVTDADGEFVKEDSFRRAGSGDTDEDNEEYRISDIEEEFSQKEDDQDRNSFVGEDGQDRSSFVGEDDQDRSSYVGEDDRDRNSFAGEDRQDRNSFVGEEGQDRNSFVDEDDGDRNSFVEDDQDRNSFVGEEGQDRNSFVGEDDQDRDSFVGEDGQDRNSFVGEDDRDRNSFVGEDGQDRNSFVGDDDFADMGGGSFRRGIADDEKKAEEDIISDNEQESSEKVDEDETTSVVDVEDAYTGVTHEAGLLEASRSIPEVREELVSDEEEDISEETSLSKITDAEGEAVEEEDFRRAGVAGIVDDEGKEEEDRISDNEKENTYKLNDGDRNRNVNVEDNYTGVNHDAHLVEASQSIPEVREELVSDVEEEDFSGEFYSQVAGNRTEEGKSGDFDSQDAGSRTGDDFDSQLNGNQTAGEPFADFSREFPVSATEQLGLEGAVDVSNQLEDEGLEDLDELDTEESDIISQTDRDVKEVSIGMEMQALGRHDVGFFESRDAETEEAEDVEAEEDEDAETSSEGDEQTTEHELDLQSEISNVLEVQTALSELEQSADARHQIEVEISEAARELEIQASVDDLTRVEAPVLEVVPAPKQKKKIRVSFSEDFDDEIGDFNISSSSRSSLKSPPPLPLSGDSESPSPSPSPENINDAAAAEEDGVSPLSAAPSRWESQEPAQRKEVYHTSAGRISISVGEEESTGSLALNSEISPSVVSFTDEIIMKARVQVGDLIESAKGTISEADLQLGDDASLHASSAAVLYSSDISEPEFTSNTSQLDFSSGTLHSVHDTAIMSEDASNNAFSIVTSDFASFDSTNLDPSAANSNPLNEARVKSLADSCNLELTEPSAVTSEPLTVSEPEPLPAVLAVNSFEDAAFDSLASMPTHVRTLSGASTGSFQGAVYSEEWQDDEFLQVAEQSGLEAEHDDPTRKKIVPEADVAEAAVADNDAEEVEDNEGKKDDDEESDAGDLEWENDTPVKIPTRPGIQPTLTEEETSPEVQRWKRVSVSGSDFDIDLQVVEPFKNVLSHGGYYDEGLSAIIVFYGCNLPSRSREDYAYIMNHLFHYVIHTLEELVADDYVIIYFHGSTPRRQMPSLAWLKRCYQSIDRRLKKNLKGLFLVHPTLWLRTVVMMTKPFISTKFSSKLRFVRTLEELNALVPLTNVTIPDPIVHYDIHHQHLPSPPPSPSHEASSH